MFQYHSPDGGPRNFILAVLCRRTTGEQQLSGHAGGTPGRAQPPQRQQLRPERRRPAGSRIAPTRAKNEGCTINNKRIVNGEADGNLRYITESFVKKSFGHNGFVHRYDIKYDSWEKCPATICTFRAGLPDEPCRPACRRPAYHRFLQPTMTEAIAGFFRRQLPPIQRIAQ
jgi:hypothetical protein